MAEIPSIKGAGVLNTWGMVHSLIDQEMVSREELMLRLDAAALEVIEEKIEPGLWYPVSVVEQLVGVVLEFGFGGAIDDLVELGRNGFRRLVERDAFRTFVDGAAEHGDRAGHALMGITRLLFNFGDWSFVGDDLQNFRVEIRDAEPLSEPLCWICLGYASAIIGHVTGEPSHLSLDRSNPACIVLHFRTG